jgi:hypothetical protein
MKAGFAYPVLAALLAVSAHAAADPSKSPGAAPKPGNAATPAANNPSPPGPEPEWKRQQRREALVRAGKELGKRGEWKEALDKFNEAAAIRIDPKLLIWMGWVKEGLGLLVEAKAHYSRARDDARAARLTQEERYAADVLAALEPKIARIALRLPTGVQTTVVIDRVPIQQLSTPIEVDPGAHDVTVTASDRVPFHRQVKLEPGREEVVEVVLSPVPAPPPTLESLQSRPLSGDAKEGSGSVGAVVVGMVGLATTVAGGAMLGVGLSQESDALKGVGIGAMVLGAGAGVGALVWGLSSGGDSPAQSARVNVILAPTHAGAFGGVGGSF